MTESLIPSHPVLMVDDEEQALNSFEMALRSGRMNNFIRCQDSRETMSLLAGQEMEVILLDLRMPHVSGEELLPTINADFPEIPVIIITGANDVETAVKCMKQAAFLHRFYHIIKGDMFHAFNSCFHIIGPRDNNHRDFRKVCVYGGKQFLPRNMGHPEIK